MKNILLALFALVAITACNNSGNKKTETQKSETVTVETADTSTVNVYYFHGKQRCKTCIAVGNVAKQTVEKSYGGSNKVVFTEINTSDGANKTLVEKYEVTWNALIIAKGVNSIEITKQAFATAVENPQSLENLLKEEINKRLQ